LEDDILLILTSFKTRDPRRPDVPGTVPIFVCIRYG